MSAWQIFVSHSHLDQAFCQALVQELRNAGADVWYDEHNLRSGPLRGTIDQELRRRQIFLLILSPTALASLWVQEETEWFYELYRKELRKPGTAYHLLPVLLESVQEAEIPLFYQGFTRIAQPNGIPYPHDEAIRRTLRALGLTPIAVKPEPLEPADPPLPEPEPVEQPEPPEPAAQPEQLEQAGPSPLEPEFVGQPELPEPAAQPERSEPEAQAEQPEPAEPAAPEPGRDGPSPADLPVKADKAIPDPTISGKIRRGFLISFAVNVLLGAVIGLSCGNIDLVLKNGWLDAIGTLAWLGEIGAGIDFIRRVFQVTLMNIIPNLMIFLGTLILVGASMSYLSHTPEGALLVSYSGPLSIPLDGLFDNPFDSFLTFVIYGNFLVLLMSIMIAGIKLWIKLYR